MKTLYYSESWSGLTRTQASGSYERSLESGYTPWKQPGKAYSPMSNLAGNKLRLANYPMAA